MNSKPGFLEGVGVAVLLSVAGAAVFAMFHPFMAVGFLLRLLLGGVSLFYVLYLLLRSRERVGRVTVLTVWLLASVIIWLFYPPILLYATLHLALIWLVRSLYFYSGVIPSLLDFGLNALAILLAVAAGLHTESLFVGLWCFFLCQALFVFIPSSVQRKTASPRQGVEDRFERAHHAAKAAVRKLSSV